MKDFYKIGMVAFSIIFLMGFINFFIQFSTTNIFSKISTGAQLIFTFCLILVFKMLLKTVSIEGGSDIEEAMQEFIK